VRNWALGYLGRFAATEAHLVVVLERKIKRHLGPAVDPDELARWFAVAETVARDMVRLGIVDDRNYAATRARSLHRKGKARQAIARDLAVKGVSQADIKAVLDELGQESGGRQAAEVEAALALARRRNIGPFRRLGPQGVEDADRLRRRAYGILARAGFSYDLARRIVEASDLAELDQYLDDLRAEEASHEP